MLAAWRKFSGRIDSKLLIPRPGVNELDVLQLFRVYLLIGWRDIATHVPELAEISAALISGILVPQKLACHLVREAEHVRLNESRLVGLKQRNAVRRNFIETGEQPVLPEISQRLV